MSVKAAIGISKKIHFSIVCIWATFVSSHCNNTIEKAVSKRNNHCYRPGLFCRNKSFPQFERNLFFFFALKKLHFITEG